MKVAVIGDGTGPHEKFVTVVEAVDENDALNWVAARIINDPDDCAVTQGEVTGECTPNRYCELYNEDGNLVYTLETAPLTGA